MERRRILKIGLWVLGVAGALFLAGSLLDAWLVPGALRVAATRAVRGALGETVQIQDVRVSLFRGDVRLTGLEAKGLALGGMRLDMTVSEVRLHIARRALLRGDLEVASVTLARPALAIRADPKVPGPGAGAGALAAPLGAERLMVLEGRVAFEDGARGLRLNAVGLEGTLVRRRDGIDYSLRVPEGRIASGSRAVSIRDAAAEGQWHPEGRIEVASLRAAGLGSTVRGRGRVGLRGWPAAPPVWDLAVEGSLDTGAIGPLFGRAVPAAGQVMYQGSVRGAGREGTFEGEAKASTLSLGPHTATAVAGRLAISGRRVRWEDVRAMLWGGAVRLSGACAWASRQCEARADARGIEIAQAIPAAGARGRLDGEGNFTGVPERDETHRATLSLRGQEIQIGAVQVGGATVEGRLEGNVLEAEGSAREGAIPFRLSGPWRPELAMQVSVGPVRDQVLGALFDQPDVTGTLHASGTLTGPPADPSFQGQIAWAPGSASGFTWDSAEGRVALVAGRLTVESATARAGKTLLALQGTAWPGPRTASGSSPMMLDLTAEGEGSLEELTRIASPSLSLAGQFRTTVRIRGSLRRPEGEARLMVRDVAVGRTRWDLGAARIRLGGGGVRLDSVTLERGVSRLEASGGVGPGGRLNLDVTATGADLAALLESPGLAGQLSGKGRVTGPWADPTVDATVRLAGVTWESMALGDLRGRLTHAHGRTEVGVRQDGGRLTFTGVLPGPTEGTAEIAVTVQELDLTPLLARSGDARLAAGRARAGGTARLVVPLARPQAVTGAVHLSPLEIALAGETWSAEGPLDIRLTPEAVQIPGAALRGRLGIVRLGGALRHDGGMDLTIQGPIPLATAALWARAIEGAGTATLNLAVTGTPAETEERGTMHLAASRLRIAGFPWELQKVDCPVVLEGRTATVGPGRAILAGGTLTGSGRLERRGQREQEQRWHVSLDGADAAAFTGVSAATKGRITGSVRGTADLSFVAEEGTDAPRTLTGPVQLRFQDGRLLQESFLLRVLEVANVTALRPWRLPELTGDGMSYRELAAAGHFDHGIAEVRELRLAGDAVRVAGTGSLDLPGQKIQMLVAVRPLTPLDTVLDKVPLLGPAVLGKEGGLVTLGYEVSGPLDDPAVRLAGARSAGGDLVDRLRKMLE